MMYLKLIALIILIVTLYSFISNIAFSVFAKLFGVKIEEFTIWSSPGFHLLKFKIGGTIFKLGWLPLSSHVKMSGMTYEEEKEIQKYDLLFKRPWQQSLIFLSSPISVLFLALFFALDFHHILLKELFIMLVTILAILIFGFSLVGATKSLIKSFSNKGLSFTASTLFYSIILFGILLTINQVLHFDDQLLGLFSGDFNKGSVWNIYREGDFGKLGFGIGILMFIANTIPINSNGIRVIRLISNCNEDDSKVSKSISNYTIFGLVVTLGLMVWMGMAFFF